MVCGGETSRLEVAKEIVKILGLEEQVKIRKFHRNIFEKIILPPVLRVNDCSIEN